jgi:hypothetical protein
LNAAFKPAWGDMHNVHWDERGDAGAGMADVAEGF